MPRRPRTSQQRELHRLEIAKLMRRGWSAARIAEQLGVSPGMVTADWRIVVKEVQESRNIEAIEKITLLLEEIAEAKREAWEAWDLSKQDAVKHTIEVSKNSRNGSAKTNDEEDKSAPPERKYVKHTKSVEGRLPANEYLKTVLSCIDREVDLQALNPGKEISMSGQVAWDAFAEQADGTTPDVIEAKLNQLMGGVVEVNNFEVKDAELVTNSNGAEHNPPPKTESPVDRVRRLMKERRENPLPVETSQLPTTPKNPTEIEGNTEKPSEKPPKTRKKLVKPGGLYLENHTQASETTDGED